MAGRSGCAQAFIHATIAQASGLELCNPLTCNRGRVMGEAGHGRIDHELVII
jgi:hypothetical protein